MNDKLSPSERGNVTKWFTGGCWKGLVVVSLSLGVSAVLESQDNWPVMIEDNTDASDTSTVDGNTDTGDTDDDCDAAAGVSRPWLSTSGHQRTGHIQHTPAVSHHMCACFPKHWLIKDRNFELLCIYYSQASAANIHLLTILKSIFFLEDNLPFCWIQLADVFQPTICTMWGISACMIQFLPF